MHDEPFRLFIHLNGSGDYGCSYVDCDTVDEARALERRLRRLKAIWNSGRRPALLDDFMPEMCCGFSIDEFDHCELYERVGQ